MQCNKKILYDHIYPKQVYITYEIFFLNKYFLINSIEIFLFIFFLLIYDQMALKNYSFKMMVYFDGMI